MQMREWALVAFTLLMQSSIGTVLVLAAASVSGARGSQPHVGMPLALAAAAAALALLASLFHLGQPAQAWLAIANVRSSWLSREILLSGLFTAAVCALAVVRGRGSPVLLAVTALFGALALYAMSRLYMVPAQPEWDRAVTLAMFLSSALLLGTMIVIAGSPLDPPSLRRLTIAAIVLLTAQGVLMAAYVRGIPGEPSAAISAAMFAGAGAWLTLARIATGALAVLLLALAVLTGSGYSPGTAVGVLAIAFVIVSELIGRILFYAGRVSIGPS